MDMRKLGSQGLEVAKLGFGCMGLSKAYDSVVSEADATRVIERAVELGVTLFDTAEVYGPYVNEPLVGKALRPVRDKVTIATKFGFIISPETGRPAGVDSRPDHIRAVCDASLKRLGVDHIDLFYQHRVDPTVPMEDVAGAVGDLIAQGKVRYFGLSEAGVESIRAAHAVHPVSALQSEYSLFTRTPEHRVLPLCRELGIGFVPYSPLGRGFLGGAARSGVKDDFRKSIPRWQGDALQANLKLLDRLEAMATNKGCTAPQLALAWLLHQGDDIVPIPGTTKVHRLEENTASADIDLDAEDLAAIAATMPEEAVQGERYNPQVAAMLEK